MKDQDAVQFDIEELLNKMEFAMRELLGRNPLLVAIRSGGLWIAERLHEALEIEEPLGALDISFYRDDYSTIGINPKVQSSSLPVPIDDRCIILIDDVLHTGRTVRAALEELFAWGRPASVVLAVLIDRGNRELPFQPDIVGRNIHLSNEQFIKLTPDGIMKLAAKAKN